MSWGYQEFAAAALVAWAVAHLAHRSWRAVARKQAPGCGACASCPAGADPGDPGPLVALDDLARTAPRRGG
jgi:hypothetical protein